VGSTLPSSFISPLKQRSSSTFPSKGGISLYTWARGPISADYIFGNTI
jgi:hypothetical protein